MNDNELDKLFGLEEGAGQDEKIKEEASEKEVSRDDDAPSEDDGDEAAPSDGDEETEGTEERPLSKKELKELRKKEKQEEKESLKRAKEEEKERLAREKEAKKEADRKKAAMSAAERDRERAAAAERYAQDLERKRAENRKKKAERARARKLAKENELPPSERQYLEGFPLKFVHVLYIFLGISVLIFAWAFLMHPAMRVQTVVVEGNYALSDEEIIDSLGIEYGEHILTGHLSAARRFVSNNPYIMSAKVTPVFPSGLKITVDERMKIAYIKTADGYIAIDDEGTVLEFSAQYTDEVHPVICGLDIDHAVIGKKLDILDDMDYQKMIIVLGAVLAADLNSTKDDDYSLFDNLQEVRIVPSGLIFITITLPEGSELQVKLDDIDNISDDMHWLMYAIEEGAMRDLPHGALDMTGDEYIFRESVS
ncbi:MAG: FtsQ-type POTRA domain-containing protein [Clostridiales bacterium]|nr:FtsQ-type POTRA domain-containing protein [Clostridiales bacterium]